MPSTSDAAQATDHRRPRGSSNAERSAYFARREAAKVLRSVLQGDSRRRAVGSIKSLVYSPSVRNKKATFALVCQTLKYLPVIKAVLEDSRVLISKWKRKEELVYIVTYDVLFGQAHCPADDVEKFVLRNKKALQAALHSLLRKKKVKSVDDLTLVHRISDVTKPRYVRVNTLKIDVESAVLELGKQTMKDSLLPDLLVLPPATDLHDHPLVLDGSIFLQGKASSMVAAALNPDPDWLVLDACSAPGNKTVHLAALMKDRGRIIACELDKKRVDRLKETIRLSGATSVQALHGDFLSVNPNDPPYSEVRAILLDPSCSGSGTSAERLDHLLPSHSPGHATNGSESGRLNKLAAFQKKALAHALSFPSVEKIVYSTCSVHQIENEDVVSSVLPQAASHGFRLASPLPEWPRRGLPSFAGSENLIRTDPAEDKEGFFIALFVRERKSKSKRCSTSTNSLKRLPRSINRQMTLTRVSRLLLLLSRLHQHN
ncbi:hypothetical protein MLD38_005905 [Melastoma candidum]|uniref:Uncharacterized protein n=1 Tax=Melastoma candidum TaxID=119954 RepID=A0ACB9RN43_9MYRT|nr:hypothetical protein MLD38_005905 [Melastoma candidum]